MPGLERELVFLSYAHEDLERILKVYEGLKERNVNVWFDKKDLGPGRWKPQVLKAISRSNYFTICLSNAAIKKTSGEKPGFQDKELQTAWEFASEQDEKDFTIIPVRLEDCGRGDMRLSGWQQYDIFEDWEGVLDKLAVNLGGVSLSDATAIDKRTEEEKILESMMGKGATFYYSGDYEKALTFFEAAINLKPDDHEAWTNKGAGFAKLGRPNEALEAYNKAIEIKHEDHLVWSNKGVALADLGRHDEALEAFSKSIEIKPDFHEAWTNKGAGLAKLGRQSEALEAYNKAIEIKPDDHKAWSNKGAALSSSGRHDEALEAFSKSIEIKPDHQEAWYNKGATLTDLGRYAEGIEAYNKSIEIEPDDYDAWYNLACLYSLKKEKDKALKYLQKAIENGFNNLSLIKEDNDLDFIRNEKEFREFISKITS
jgi:tetratricopeptide (TPR) repeat protein